MTPKNHLCQKAGSGPKNYGFEDFVDHKLDGLDGEVQRSEF